MPRERFESVVELLKRNPRVRLAYAFGSALSSPETARDLDVAVLLDSKPSWHQERELRAEAATAARAVDLTILNRAPPMLRREVVTTGRCLFARDVRERTEFELAALARYLDFLPMRRVQEIYLRERVEERRGSAR
jgi:predicted nucleotidyltransferase